MIIDNDKVRKDLLPYDFVRSNEVIVTENEGNYLIISTKDPSRQIFEELQTSSIK